MAQSMVWVLLALASLAAAGIFLTVSLRARETRKKNERAQKEKQARAEKKMAGRRVRKLAENGPVGPVSPAGRAASLAPKTPQLNALHEKLAMASANSDIRLGQAAGAAFYSALFEDAESEADAALSSSARAETRAATAEKALELGLSDPANEPETASGLGQPRPFVPSYPMPEHANVFAGAEVGEDLFAHARAGREAGRVATEEPARHGLEVSPHEAEAVDASLAPHAEDRRELAQMGELLEPPFAQVGETQRADWGFGETLAAPLAIEGSHFSRQQPPQEAPTDAQASDLLFEHDLSLGESPPGPVAEALAEEPFAGAPSAEPQKAQEADLAAAAVVMDWEQEFLSALAGGVATDAATRAITQASPATPAHDADVDAAGAASISPPEERAPEASALVEAPRSLREAQEVRKSRVDRGDNDALSDELRAGSDELMDIAVRQQGRDDWWNDAAKKDSANGWSDEEEPVAPWTALVVDDSGVARAKVSRILKQMGCHVKDARDGQEAWEMMAHWKPDLLVSDIEMPRLNGLDLSRRVKNDLRLASVPIIVMTGHLNSHLDEFADAQINGFLPKPFEDKDLQDQAKFLLAAANA